MAKLNQTFVATDGPAVPPLNSTGRFVLCPHCGQRAQLVRGDKIYPHLPSLWHKAFYQCAPCDAYVGTHRNSNFAPLGTPANAPLRAARKRAHAVFDLIWRSKLMSRTEAYAALAAKLGIKPRDCHIGMFNERQCAAVVEACRELSRGKTA